jgi:tetraacyldisaccharide-1-P 4'-kinase
LKGLARADCVAWSGVSQGSSLATLCAGISSWFQGPALAYRYANEGVFRAADDSAAGDRLARALVFSGIGNHRRFVDDLRGLGWSIGGEVSFPDHHVYRREDIYRVIREFQDVHADVFVTTEKDAVRLAADPEVRENFLKAYPVLYSRIVVEVTEGHETLERLLDDCLTGGGRTTQKLLQTKTEFQTRHITTKGLS